MILVDKINLQFINNIENSSPPFLEITSKGLYVPLSIKSIPEGRNNNVWNIRNISIMSEYISVKKTCSFKIEQ